MISRTCTVAGQAWGLPASRPMRSRLSFLLLVLTGCANHGGGGAEAATDIQASIAATTDNFPVLSAPSLDALPRSGHTVHLAYSASDADWPVDPYETMTFFSTVLAGHVSGSSTTFNLGNPFEFTPLDGQPVTILGGV